MLGAVELYTRRGWVIALTTLFGFIILVGAGLLGSETALGVILIGAGLLFGARPRTGTRRSATAPGS
jgi:hypothetical protein